MTAQEAILQIEDENIRDRALYYLEIKDKLLLEVKNTYHALSTGFNWANTAEGSQFWVAQCNKYKK